MSMRAQGHQVDLASLSLSGMRVGPIKDGKPVVGLVDQPRRHNDQQQTVFVKKSLSGFGAGFKIPEEYRKNKLMRKSMRKEKDQDDTVEQVRDGAVTRDEIVQLLNLGNSDGGIGAGKYGNSSKQALTNDLTEGLEKDLEKLKRMEESIKMRKILSMKGGKQMLEENDETRKAARIGNLRADVEAEGAHCIEVNEERLQLLRHKPGTLDSVKDMNEHELEATRKEQSKILEELANRYYAKTQNKEAGKMIRKMMGYDRKDKARAEMEEQFKDFDLRDDLEGDASMKLGGSRKGRSRSRRGGEDDEAVPMGGSKRSRSRKRSAMEDADTPPTRGSSKRHMQRGSDDSPLQDKEDGFSEDEGAGGFFGKKKKKSVTIGGAIDKSPVGTKSTGMIKPLKSALAGSSLDMGKVGKSRSGSRRNRPESRSISLKRDISHNQSSPHREIYEAKFEKFMVNKKQKTVIDKRVKAYEKPDFDVTTKGLSSPSKRKDNYTTVVGAEIDFKPSGKFDSDFLMPKGYEDHLMREEILKERNDDPFKLLGVSNDDKMAFFLLKWVFNAIKRSSDNEDRELKGQPYVLKSELVTQLAQNNEILDALRITDKRALKKEVKKAKCAKEGCMTWQDFCEFHFMRDASYSDRMKESQFYQKIDLNGELIKTDEKDKGRVTFDDMDGEDELELYKQKRQQKLLLEYQDVPMTPALKSLIDTRKRKIVDDVEQEFSTMQETRGGMGHHSMGRTAGSSGGFSKGVAFQQSGEDAAAHIGFKREKSKCLLLPSQIEMMRMEFQSQDRHKEQIVRRSDFLIHMRTTPCIVNFIGDNAVKLKGARGKVLTVDQIFHEIELDENYEQSQLAKDELAINHKEFISWSDFLSYFEDYKEIEERNQRTKKIAKESVKESQTEMHPEEEQLATLLETEKQRRLQEMPKPRPADMIDISNDQLVLLKGIYDKCPKTGGQANTLSFFTSLRNEPKIKQLQTTIARDPEGHSRMPTETFQQVFDRMERELQTKTIDWETIIEYFTKRGRPLSKEEIRGLQEQDERIKQEQAEIKRKEEEQERRRVARLMEEMQGDEEFNEFTMNNGQDKDRDSDEDSYDSEDDFSDRDMGSEDAYCSDESDLARDVGVGLRARGPRGKSARPRRSSEDEDLRSKTVTVDDYMSKMRSNSQRKGRYGITVPQPFQFDLRDKTKTKNIRERKVEEMVIEKEIEENNMVKHQFRSKPIPASVLVPKYQAIQEANEQRRLRVKQESIEITKMREAPFSFWERDKAKQARKKYEAENPPVPDECKKPHFRAGEIPSICSFPFYQADLVQKEKDREKRIKAAAKASHAAAAYPRGMQSAMSKQPEKEALLASKQEQYSFQPMINKAKTGAMFKRMQDSFQEKLSTSKASQRVTVPKSPKFKSKASKPMKREYVNEGEPGKQGQMADKVMNQATGGDKFKAALASKTMGATSGGLPPKSLGGTGGSKMSTSKAPVKQPSSTRKDMLLQQRRREEIEAKKKEEERVAKENEARIAKQNQLKKSFQEKMKGTMKDAKGEIERKAKEFRLNALEEEKKTQARLQEVKERGRNRPMLVDSYNKKGNDSNLARLKTTKDFVKVMKETGATDKEAEQFLSMEDKELLEQDRFIQLQKKRYGKTDQP